MSERMTEVDLARIADENEADFYGSADAVRLVAEVRRLRELIVGITGPESIAESRRENAYATPTLTLSTPDRPADGLRPLIAEAEAIWLEAGDDRAQNPTAGVPIIYGSHVAPPDVDKPPIDECPAVGGPHLEIDVTPMDTTAQAPAQYRCCNCGRMRIP